MSDVTKQRRPRSSLWDRLRILILLGVVIFLFTWQGANAPFVTWGEAFSEFLSSTFGAIMGVLFVLEVVRQIHYVISENWATYNHFWQERIFRGTERFTQRNVSDWARYRFRRIVTFFILLLIYGVLVTIIRDDVANPFEALLKFPEVAGDALGFLIPLSFGFLFIMVQFVGLFWLLSRGGIDVVYPQNIETRFDDVKGQDHVLQLVRENIAFLEQPDEIEAKGGYIPGGILLWGPPGTGKTLMAESIAGEIGKPYVFVDPGAFIQMFFGIGILKVKRLFRKLRKLSVQHGGVVVFFDEADSLGNRGGMQQGGPGPFQPMELLAERFDHSCNGYAYLSPEGRRIMMDEVLSRSGPPQAEPQNRWVDKIIMGGMGGGGGMGTLQALLTEISGLKKPRGLSNRARRLLGMKPKPPPKYRILIMMATNMPNALDQALLRPGRIDRIYKVGYPSMEGRKDTFNLYLSKVKHTLTNEDVEQLSIRTPYYSGAKIKDLVNEALILAIRDDRDTVVWDDVWRAKTIKEHGPPDDFEFVERERHAVAVHEASHAVAAHLLRKTATIDVATIERRGDIGGFVSSLPVEDRMFQWRTEHEIDIKVSLASLVGERMFFQGDNSAGVGSDLRNATNTVSLMEGVWGMGEGITSLLGVPETIIWQAPDPTDKVVGTMPNRIEKTLKRLYDETWELLKENKDKVEGVAAALEEHKTISGDQVAEIIGVERGAGDLEGAKGFSALELDEDLPLLQERESQPESGDGKASSDADDEVDDLDGEHPDGKAAETETVEVADRKAGSKAEASEASED